MPSFGSMGGGLYFIISVTSSIVVLFLVRIGAVLLLRKHFVLYASILCFLRTLCCFYGMIISVVGCRQSSCSYNMDSSSAEYRRTCTSVCKHVSVACLFVPNKLNYLRLKKSVQDFHLTFSKMSAAFQFLVITLTRFCILWCSVSAA